MIWQPRWGCPRLPHGWLLPGVGTFSAEAAGRVLASEGWLVNIGSSAGPAARFESATVRSRLHNILGYTNNALSHEQKAQALTEILTHAAAGRCTVECETIALARVAEVWQRQAARAGCKLILVP